MKDKFYRMVQPYKKETVKAIRKFFDLWNFKSILKESFTSTIGRYNYYGIFDYVLMMVSSIFLIISFPIITIVLIVAFPVVFLRKCYKYIKFVGYVKIFGMNKFIEYIYIKRNDLRR